MKWRWHEDRPPGRCVHQWARQWMCEARDLILWWERRRRRRSALRMASLLHLSFSAMNQQRKQYHNHFFSNHRRLIRNRHSVRREHRKTIASVSRRPPSRSTSNFVVGLVSEERLDVTVLDILSLSLYSRTPLLSAPQCVIVQAKMARPSSFFSLSLSSLLFQIHQSFDDIVSWLTTRAVEQVYRRKRRISNRSGELLNDHNQREWERKNETDKKWTQVTLIVGARKKNSCNSSTQIDRQRERERGRRRRERLVTDWTGPVPSPTCISPSTLTCHSSYQWSTHFFFSVSPPILLSLTHSDDQRRCELCNPLFSLSLSFSPPRFFYPEPSMSSACTTYPSLHYIGWAQRYSLCPFSVCVSLA